MRERMGKLMYERASARSVRKRDLELETKDHSPLYTTAPSQSKLIQEQQICLKELRTKCALSFFPRKELFLGIRIIGISLEESESELLLPTLFSFCFPFISLSLELSSLSKYISLSFEFNSSVVVSTLSLVPSP